MVILHNYGTSTYDIKVGDRIAQMVFYSIKTPTPHPVSSLPPTSHGDSGLGSTGIVRSAQKSTPQQDVPTRLPYDIWMSNDPFDALIPVQIDLKGNHPTLGMVLELCPDANRLCLKDILPSTPAAKIKKWRSTIRNHHLVSINTQPIRTIDALASLIKTCMDNNHLFIELCFSVDKYYGINPTSQITIYIGIN